MNWSEELSIKAKERVSLEKIDPDSVGKFTDKEEAKAVTSRNVQAIAELQYKLYASNTRSLLVILQGMDAAGKDGVVNHVFAVLNPQGCRVQSFKQPTPLEASHDFLWRAHRVVPARGEVVVFNRSYYERVLVERVLKLCSTGECEAAYGHIRDFEELLNANGTKILKFFLHISREEQLERFMARLDDPEKQWKISLEDYRNRPYWNDYEEAFERMLDKCSTVENPWFVIPANHKYFRDLAISSIVLEALESMKLNLPAPRVDLAEARRLAEAELAGEAALKKSKKDAKNE